MNKKHLVFACGVMFLALCVTAKAQQPGKVHRIGFLTGGGNTFSFEAFKHGLKDFGYKEGENISIEYRSADGHLDRIPDQVAELVRLKVDVLVTTSPAVRAAKRATKTIPIVMITQEDPIASGLVSSLARPGENLTGLTSLARDLSSKRLALLKEVIPKLTRVGVLWDTTDATKADSSFKEYETEAAALKIAIQSMGVRGPTPDLEGALRAGVKGQVGALIVIRNFLFNRYENEIANLAIKHRLPSMFERIDYVRAGGLMSYSTDDAGNYERAAYYVDKIFKGVKPADLPIEQPTKFEFVISLITAKQIGLTIPNSVLYRADKVIK
ncbi:MAG: ABC transporter substrate-binding protein [Candidatus Binatia bacterium]